MNVTLLLPHFASNDLFKLSLFNQPFSYLNSYHAQPPFVLLSSIVKRFFSLLLRSPMLLHRAKLFICFALGTHFPQSSLLTPNISAAASLFDACSAVTSLPGSSSCINVIPSRRPSAGFAPRPFLATKC